MKTALVLVFVVVLLLAGCTQQAGQSNVVKVGVLTPLTGNFSTLGQRIVNGMTLAKEDLTKEKPERKIDLIVEDACVAADAVSGFNKMTNIDQIKWLGGSFCLVGFVPIIPLAEQKNIPIFNTAANPS